LTLFKHRASAGHSNYSGKTKLLAVGNEYKNPKTIQLSKGSVPDVTRANHVVGGDIIFDTSMNLTGIYIHIPFCRSRCSYCDFATGLYATDTAVRYVNALVAEIERCSFSRTPVDTIYFGGGTPSLLLPKQVERILSAVARVFCIEEKAEVTMEMNPGSAGATAEQLGTQTTSQLRERLREFRDLGVNRVSFGAQSFDDLELARLGRSHDAGAIRKTFERLREAGFENISFDLIAGLPGQTLTAWTRNVMEALALRPEHLSFYLLEVHEGTPLAAHIKAGKQPQPDADLAADMYELMLDRSTTAGYQHYEISNLCLTGRQSRHNTKYWTGEPYLGFGCSAHSFDGKKGRWSNDRDVNRYVSLIEEGSSAVVESQTLSEADRRAEAMFLGLRMMEGVDARIYKEHFGLDVREEYREQFQLFSEAGLIEFTGDRIKLTRPGALLSNEVFAAFV
jgi:putative oxygen-independent coproporphyrinogen III oxidase